MTELRLWSVTELIKLGIPAPALTGWTARVTAESAVRQRSAWLAMADHDEAGAIDYVKNAHWRTSGKAADRGNALHAHAKAMALGVPPPAPPPEAAAHVAQFVRFLDEHTPEYVAAEAPVYNLDYHYAGTLDAIVRLGGRLCVLDYKTTDKGPDAPSRPPYPEVALQLCAYARATRLGLPGSAEISEVRRRRYYVYRDDMAYEPMPVVEGGLALMVSPHDYELHPVRIDDSVWAAFLHAREVARWVLEVSKSAIGPVVVPQPQPVPAAVAERRLLAEADGLIKEGVLVAPGAEEPTWDEWFNSLPRKPAGGK